mgnify:CR=1 FL=1
MSDYNDWDNVVIIRKKKTTAKERKSDKLVNIALRNGQQVTTKVKDVSNKNNNSSVDFRKLEDNNDAGKHKKVTLSLGRTIMKARNLKNISQKDFAQRINEKPAIINSYEQGKAIPNNQILMKMQKILGVKLTGKNIGDPLN